MKTTKKEAKGLLWEYLENMDANSVSLVFNAPGV